CLPIWRPGQMIAGKEKLILIKQDGVSARVAGNRNGDQIIICLDRLLSSNHTFDTEPCGAIISVHYSVAAISLCEARMIGHIVSVCQEHRAHAAHGVYFLYQLRSETRRVYQHVAAFPVGTNNQIAPSAETRLRSEAAEENVVGNERGKCVD